MVVLRLRNRSFGWSLGFSASKPDADRRFQAVCAVFERSTGAPRPRGRLGQSCGTSGGQRRAVAGAAGGVAPCRRAGQLRGPGGEGPGAAPVRESADVAVLDCPIGEELVDLSELGGAEQAGHEDALGRHAADPPSLGAVDGLPGPVLDEAAPPRRSGAGCAWTACHSSVVSGRAWTYLAPALGRRVTDSTRLAKETNLTKEEFLTIVDPAAQLREER